MVFLLIEKIIVLDEYSNYVNIFLKKSARILPENTKINEYTIKLKKNQQLFYGLIYSLSFVK